MSFVEQQVEVAGVSEYAARIGRALRQVGGGVVEGEVQRPKRVGGGGMLVFDISDGEAVLSCKVFARDLRRLDDALSRRVEADPESAERGLVQLVLTLVERLRELMERQALRRMEAGTLTDDEIERLGQTFLALRGRMEELKDVFGLRDEDLNIDLGPLGRLR